MFTFFNIRCKKKQKYNFLFKLFINILIFLFFTHDWCIAYQLDKDDYEKWLAFYKEKNYEEALKYLEKIVAEIPEDENYQIWREFYSIGKYQEGIKHLETLIAKIPEDDDYEVWKKSYVSSDYKNGIAHLEKLIAGIPDNYDYSKWKEFYIAGKYYEAIEHLERLVGELEIEEEAMWVRKSVPSLELRVEKYRHLAKVEKWIAFIAEQEFTYDNNLYRNKSNKSGSIISASKIGADIAVGPEAHKIKGSYYTSFYDYFNDTEQNRFDHNFSLDFNSADIFNISKRIGKRVNVNIREDFHPGTFRPTSEDTQPRSLFDNKFDFEIGYPISPKTSIGAHYSNFLRHSFDSLYKDYDHFRNLLGGRFYYHITPKTSISTGYNYESISYPNKENHDSFTHSIESGIQGQLTAKSTVNLSINGQYRKYIDNDDLKKIYLLGMSGSYSNKLTPRTMLSLFVSRQLNESTLADNPYYSSSQYGVRLNHNFRKLDLYGSMSMLFIDYPSASSASYGKKRKDTSFGPGLGVIYKMNRWVSLFLDYMCEYRNSNVKANEYSKTQISTGIKSRF